tara:strand:- start:76 stop:357 length:282 start_codon:yes stop_codon:yes gene_type:complete
MVDTHKAILNLYPNVVTVDDTAGAMDKDGNNVEIDQALVNAWVDPEAYKYQRVAEYPPHADYLDGIVKGDDAQVQKYIDDCLAVKAKYPKGNK